MHLLPLLSLILALNDVVQCFASVLPKMEVINVFIAFSTANAIQRCRPNEDNANVWIPANAMKLN